MLALVYLTIEVLSLVVFSLAAPEAFSFDKLAARRSAILAGGGHDAASTADTELGGWAFEDSILHPYLGFARQPAGKEDARSLGFRRVPALPAAPADEVTVGVVGGSVAESFFNHITASDEWTAALRSIPGLEGARISHVLLGLRGYKQPQQLLATAYYLSLGGDLDILINLDGYNEVALAGELLETGVFPGYPYHWRPLTAASLTLREQQAIARIGGLRDLERSLAGLGERFAFSVTASTFWYLMDRRVALGIAESSRQLAAASGEEGAFPYFRVGPAAAWDEEAFYLWAAGVWAGSSAQLHALAKANRFAYFHFLQPNQYLPGSKTLSAVEKERFFLAGSRGDRLVRGGYPRLIEAGQGLNGDEVVFYDLSRVFQDTRATVYVDPCCHLNERGNRLLARAIAQVIRERGATPTSTPR